MSTEKKLLQQRLRPCHARGFQRRIRGWQFVAPHKDERVNRGTFQLLRRTNPGLVYRTVAGSRRRKRLRRLQGNGTEGLLILGQILSQKVPQGLRLLRA